MKIWQNIPLYVDPSDVPAVKKSPGQDAVGQIFTWDIPVFTRSRKIESMRKALDAHLASSYRAPDMPLGLWIGGSVKRADELMRTWITSSVAPGRISCLIRDLVEADEKPNELNDASLNSRMHIFLHEKFDPRGYESLFYSLSRSGYQGIAINVERAQRSIITLAHRFELTSIVTGVVHERQEQIAIKSGADAVIVR